MLALRANLTLMRAVTDSILSDDANGFGGTEMDKVRRRAVFLFVRAEGWEKIMSRAAKSIVTCNRSTELSGGCIFFFSLSFVLQIACAFRFVSVDVVHFLV